MRRGAVVLLALAVTACVNDHAVGLTVSRGGIDTTGVRFGAVVRSSTDCVALRQAASRGEIGPGDGVPLAEDGSGPDIDFGDPEGPVTIAIVGADPATCAVTIFGCATVDVRDTDTVAIALSRLDDVAGCASDERCEAGVCVPDVASPCATGSGPCELVDGAEGRCCDGLCLSEADAAERCGACAAECVDGTCCGDACVDLSSSVDHCGACGRACRSERGCEAGLCFCAEDGGGCAPGERCCGELCVDTQTSREHCGDCGRRCAGECRDGVCEGGLECADGTCEHTCCGDACVDTRFDAANCGGCGIPCDGSCIEGDCSDGSPPIAVRVTPRSTPLAGAGIRGLWFQLDTRSDATIGAMSPTVTDDAGGATVAISGVPDPRHFVCVHPGCAPGPGCDCVDGSPILAFGAIALGSDGIEEGLRYSDLGSDVRWASAVLVWTNRGLSEEDRSALFTANPELGLEELLERIAPTGPGLYVVDVDGGPTTAATYDAEAIAGPPVAPR